MFDFAQVFLPFTRRYPFLAPLLVVHHCIPKSCDVPRSAPFGGLYFCAITNSIVLITSCPNRYASRHSINIETFKIKIFMLKGLDGLSMVEARPIPPPERRDAGVGAFRGFRANVIPVPELACGRVAWPTMVGCLISSSYMGEYAVSRTLVPGR